jgi:hypothetical protein
VVGFAVGAKGTTPSGGGWFSNTVERFENVVLKGMFKTDAQVDEWGRGIAEAQKLGPAAVAAFLRNGNLPTWPKDVAAAAVTGGVSLEAGAGKNIYVLGRQVDTAVAKDWAGHSVLDIPNWTLAKNDAWVKNIIDQKATAYLASPQTRATLWDAANNRMTVFARELQQLTSAGYKQAGDYMVPPK